MDTGTETLRRTAFMPRYHAWIAEQMRGFLGSRILEVGCGTGAITQHLLASGATVVGVDLREDYLQVCREAFDSTERFTAARCDVQSAEFVGLQKHGPDTVVCANVLEHVEDDRLAIGNMASVLPGGGNLIVVVPALRWLWGTLDEALSHRRRYEPQGIRDALEDAGLEVVVIRYFNLLGLSGWYLNGRMMHRRLLPLGQLRLYDHLVPIIRWAESAIPPPVGQSLLAVGRKPG